LLKTAGASPPFSFARELLNSRQTNFDPPSPASSGRRGPKAG
jgi:hypothetical protein